MWIRNHNKIAVFRTDTVPSRSTDASAPRMNVRGSGFIYSKTKVEQLEKLSVEIAMWILITILDTQPVVGAQPLSCACGVYSATGHLTLGKTSCGSSLQTLPHADVIYFCSPNNPTGAVATKAQLEALVAHAMEKVSKRQLSAPSGSTSNTLCCALFPGRSVYMRRSIPYRSGQYLKNTLHYTTIVTEAGTQRRTLRENGQK